jgi:hypothetical protein
LEKAKANLSKAEKKKLEKLIKERKEISEKQAELARKQAEIARQQAEITGEKGKVFYLEPVLILKILVIHLALNRWMTKLLKTE